MPAISITTSRSLISRIALFAGLLSAAILLPLINIQPVTGILVNATLFIAAASLGVREAMLIGLLPSVISLSTGLLPAVLAPMIPFIMVGNILLVYTFDLLRQRLYWQSSLLAAAVKFLFLFAASFIVGQLITNASFASKAAAMMGWIQLATALSGALVAYGVLLLLKRAE